MIRWTSKSLVAQWSSRSRVTERRAHWIRRRFRLAAGNDVPIVQMTVPPSMISPESKCNLFGEIREGLEAYLDQPATLPKRELSEPDVKAIREQFGLSQSQMAAFLNVSKRTLANWEQGRRGPTGPRPDPSENHGAGAARGPTSVASVTASEQPDRIPEFREHTGTSRPPTRQLNQRPEPFRPLAARAARTGLLPPAKDSTRTAL